ncbi:aminotransferase class V-fold PLP-dependent enzyme [Portibacter lacus]|uniref:Cysteine desulfurase n=1 Tax=Portibacter lacus TaxID=1099794 RepID=A0AA37SQT9_9BACT|nr:aminotransferase class V-fold PLP-dependent enzyme [Portibacter lacus]GLR17934.1 cysteine desulfurase [Portibacter lacus]
MFNSSDIKKNFPIFDHYPDLVFADNASTTQKPSNVIDAISDYYKTSNANVHRAVYDLGVKSDEIYHNTRLKLCQFYNKEEAIFTGGTTDGINKLARAISTILENDSNIVVSEMEHHSNLLPWQALHNELRVARMTDTGDLDLAHLASLIDDQTRVVSLVHISNTLGSINDLSKVANLLAGRNCIFIVDAAQSCLLHRDSISKINADAFVFGAHKMFGPSGLGVLLAKQKFLDQLPSFDLGGGMVTEVEEQHAEFRKDISRFEAGTPPLAQVAGMHATLTYLEGLDLGQCITHTHSLAIKLRESLSEIGVQCLGNPKDLSGIVSATFGEIHPHDAASFLNSKNIAVRAGHHCTQLIMKKYDIHASVRFSFSIYNDLSDVEKIVDAVKSMKKYFG